MNEPTPEKPLPTGPDDMPMGFHNDENGLRNILVTLSQYAFVEIIYRADDAESNANDQNIGKWTVTLENGSRRVNVEHEEITNALWFANLRMSALNTAAYDARDAAKKAALAKLSSHERELLGV